MRELISKMKMIPTVSLYVRERERDLRQIRCSKRDGNDFDDGEEEEEEGEE